MNSIDLQKMRERIRDRHITSLWAELRGAIVELVESHNDSYGHSADEHSFGNSSIIVTKDEGLHADGFHSILKTTQLAIDGRKWRISGVTATQLVRDGKSTPFGKPAPFSLTIEADVEKGSLYIVDENGSRLTALQAAENHVGAMLLGKTE